MQYRLSNATRPKVSPNIQILEYHLQYSWSSSVSSYSSSYFVILKQFPCTHSSDSRSSPFLWFIWIEPSESRPGRNLHPISSRSSSSIRFLLIRFTQILVLALYPLSRDPKISFGFTLHPPSASSSSVAKNSSSKRIGCSVCTDAQYLYRQTQKFVAEDIAFV